MTVEDGRIVTDPDLPALRRTLAEMRVLDRRGKRVTPEDGDRWLEGLQRNYNGAYCRGVFIR